MPGQEENLRRSPETAAELISRVSMERMTARLREAVKSQEEAIRDAALEEAASACMGLGKEIVCPEECAATIRAMKSDPAQSVTSPETTRAMKLADRPGPVIVEGNHGSGGAWVRKEYERATVTAQQVWEAMRVHCPRGGASDGSCSPGLHPCAFESCPLLKEARDA